jgi:hypothetical protein
MPRMTEEEANALDDFITNNPPIVDPLKARHITRMVALDDFTIEYIFSQSMVTHKTPTEIISNLVKEKLTNSV